MEDLECKYFVEKTFFKRGKLLVNECIRETVTQESYDKMWQEIYDTNLLEKYYVNYCEEFDRDYFEIEKKHPSISDRFDSINIIISKLSEV